METGIGLACISHQYSAADADKLAVAVCAPCSRFDVVSTTTAPTSSPRSPPQRHLDTLATKAGEKRRLIKMSIPVPVVQIDRFTTIYKSVARICYFADFGELAIRIMQIPLHHGRPVFARQGKT
jgi:hypothetical protein